MLNHIHLEGLIPILGGIYAVLLVKGVIPKNQKNPEKMEAWRKKFGPILNILGLIVILFGILWASRNSLNCEAIFRGNPGLL